jgi:thermitase
MKRKHLLTIILIIVFSLSATGGLAQSASKKQPEAPELPEHIPGELLIRFSPGMNAPQVANEMAQMGLVHRKTLPGIGVQLVSLPPGLTVQGAMERFSQRPGVEFAEPNYILKAQAPTEVIVDEHDQWALDKIAAPSAWSQFGPEPYRPLLAIVDTGITFDHPDLVNNLWENPGETGLDDLGNDKRVNGVDDDVVKNGLVDDWRGWDFVHGDNDPTDDQMHGTAVSSVAAAEENGIGIAGVCPWCQLIGVKVLDSSGAGNLAVVAEGILYAAQMGADVINLSLGATSTAETLGLAVADAWNAGAVVVAGAGNNGLKTLFYPAAYPEAMAVASTGGEDNHSCFSNYSPNFISVSAPGEGVIVADITNQDTGYGYYNGTSLSAPHVTGLAGLLFSQDPARTNQEVRSIIEDSAVDLGPPGYDDAFGYGRIDSLRAVTLDFSPVLPLDGLFSDDATASGYAHARKLVRDDSGRLHMIWHTKQEGPTYRIRYANSTDNGTTWNLMPDAYASGNETYHPALATDGEYLFAAIPSKIGPGASANYQIMFTRKLLPDGGWETAVPLMGGTYHTVRPDLFLDPTNGRLHVLASSLDHVPEGTSDLYYRASQDQGANWDDLRIFNPSNSTPKTRYATLHAHGDNIYVVARTVSTIANIITYYYMHTVHSTNGGVTWTDQTEISSFLAFTSGEYGISLAGVGDRVYMAYEVGSNLYFRYHDGTIWSDYETLELGDAENINKWPTITQAEDGQAWILFEVNGELYRRHYDGSTWAVKELIGPGNYANYKLGTSDERVEWVSTRCNGSPFLIEYDWASADAQPTPTPPPTNHHIPLVPGWNLVSFNLQPADTSIDLVLGSIAGSYDLVYAWDGATQTWQQYDPSAPAYSNTLQNLDEKRGFWIHITFPVILSISGTPPSTTDIPVYSTGTGWNLVGYPSAMARNLPGALQDHGVGTDFSLVYAYQSNDPADPWKLFDRTTPPFSNDLISMTPGLGYWIKVSGDNTWQVDYSNP